MDKTKSTEITRQMIDAGVERLFDFAPECRNFELAVKEIYSAMLSASQPSTPCKQSKGAS